MLGSFAAKTAVPPAVVDATICFGVMERFDKDGLGLGVGLGLRARGTSSPTWSAPRSFFGASSVYAEARVAAVFRAVVLALAFTAFVFTIAPPLRLV